MSAPGRSGATPPHGADPADPADPVERHVSALAAVLRGADRDKARMLDELREGLLDAAADLAPEHPSSEDAAREAVRQFGGVAELAPEFQRELTVAQARRTSRRILLLVPLLLSCWYALAAAAPPTAQGLPVPVQVLLAHLGGAAAAAALAAAVFLAATGRTARRVSVSDRLPVMVGWAGTTAAVALALGALTLGVAALLAAAWPLCLLAGAVALACHAQIAASARACRRCARLPVAA
ncbi:permease prefix domain 1-containing protein [Streptomyces sp. NPDC085612]|uniref:permease prefix domain 1-containing protein n=1 Tax=Streptomyces sp. NPDC085612 TaxID=3365732 RepID=UPI0037D6C4CB